MVCIKPMVKSVFRVHFFDGTIGTVFICKQEKQPLWAEITDIRTAIAVKIPQRARCTMSAFHL